MRPTAALGLLIAAYLALCAVYIAKTPYRQAGVLVHQGGQLVPDIGAPDERQHANYVQHLLLGRGFPVLVPGSQDLGETYQSHQPPLYYLLAAGFCKLTGSDPVDHASGARLRWLNALIGAGTLLGVFFAARWGLQSDGVALAAVAFTGLMPMFVALHAAVGNDPLLFLESTWALALCARGIRFGWEWKLALSVGLVCGAGLLTKTTALALVPTVFVALAASRLWCERKPRASTWVIALLVPFVVGAPWMARNQRLYGDPFAIAAFNAAFVGSPRPQDVVIPDRILDGDPEYAYAAQRAIYENPDLKGRDLIDKVFAEEGMTGAAKADYWTNWVGWWTARSYVGVFGYMDVFLFEHLDEPSKGNALYRLSLALFGLLFIGALVSVRRGPDAACRAFHATGGALFVVVALLFVRFNLQYFQGQARYLYPAVAPVSIGLALGLAHWLGRRKEWAWAIAAAFLIVLQVEAVTSLSTGFAARVR